MPKWSLTKAIIKKLQRAIVKKNLNAKLKGRIRNTGIRQRTSVTNTVVYLANVKWKWAGLSARMKRQWSISRTVWEIEGVRSARRPIRQR